MNAFKEQNCERLEFEIFDSGHPACLLWTWRGKLMCSGRRATAAAAADRRHIAFCRSNGRSIICRLHFFISFSGLVTGSVLPAVSPAFENLTFKTCYTGLKKKLKKYTNFITIYNLGLITVAISYIYCFQFFTILTF